MHFKQSEQFNNNVSLKLNFLGNNWKTTKCRKYSTSLWANYSQITMNSFWWGMYICLASPICALPVGKAVHQGCQTTSVSKLTKCTITLTCVQPFGTGIIIFFLILAHTVYKMWIIQETNMLELWNKLHFEEKKTESIYHVWNIQYLYLLNKYMKCNV
jgi:hypothetical protein